MITVIATISCAAGKEDEFKAAFAEMIDAVGANEKGKALAYTLHQSTDEPTQFAMYEQYADAAALEAHGTTAHMQAFGAKLGTLIGGGPPEIKTYTVVKGI